MEKSIREIYVPVTSQEQADRLKAICVKYGLPIWEGGFEYATKHHTTTQIEALRERLKETLGDNFDFEPIDETFNNFLKEINDGK